MPPYSGSPEEPSHYEQSTSPQREFFQLVRGRPDYVPTPLAADNARTPEDRDYYSAVFEKIEALLDDESERQPQWMRDFALTSLMGAVHRRLWHNRSSLHAHETAVADGEIVLDEDSTRMVEAAKQGTASIDELLVLPSEVPSLPAVELAKISHPFRWETTFEMDVEVRQAIKRQEAKTSVTWLAESNHEQFAPQYSFKSSDRPVDADAIVVTRKEPVAALGNEQLVMSRSAYIIRLQEEPDKVGQLGLPPALRRHCTSLVKLQHIRRHLPKNDEQIQENTRLAEEQLLASIGEHIEQELAREVPDRAAWLNPTSSTYYSRKLKPEERLALIEVPRFLRESMGSAAVLPVRNAQTA